MNINVNVCITFYNSLILQIKMAKAYFSNKDNDSLKLKVMEVQKGEIF